MTLHEEWREAALTRHRGQFLDRLRAAPRKADSGIPSQRIALYTSTTWRPLLPFLEGELLVEGVETEFTTFEYESMAADIARGAQSTGAQSTDAQSTDAQSNDSMSFDTIVLAIDHESDVGSTEAAEQLELFASALAARTGQLLVFNPPSPQVGPHGLKPSANPPTIGPPRRGVERLDWAEVFPPGRVGDAFDPRRYALGRIRYSEEGFALLATTIARRVLRRVGVGLKAVIVDLDNTLWGGAVGDVGTDGIELGSSYPGVGYQDLQAELARWKRAGILLAIASKNEPSNALGAIRDHEQMRLRVEDFSHTEIHWEPKSVSVGRILERFNISASSVLFIDDNPREREEVARQHPELRIFEFPDEPYQLAPTLRAISWPLLVGESDEDQRRAELQAQLAARQEAQSVPEARDDFLSSLGIELQLRIDEKADIARGAQLHQKTNQFNLNPERFTEAQLESLRQGPGSHVVTVGYLDRFGDAGTIAAATLSQPSTESGWSVHTFLMSCRVLGLGVETTVLIWLAERFGPLEFEYRVTPKNIVARRALDGALSFPEESGTASLRIEALPPTPWISLQTTPETSHV